MLDGRGLEGRVDLAELPQVRVRRALLGQVRGREQDAVLGLDASDADVRLVADATSACADGLLREALGQVPEGRQEAEWRLGFYAVLVELHREHVVVVVDFDRGDEDVEYVRELDEEVHGRPLHEPAIDSRRRLVAVGLLGLPLGYKVCEKVLALQHAVLVLCRLDAHVKSRGPRVGQNLGHRAGEGLYLDGPS